MKLMKYQIEQSARFKRELKTAIKRGYDMQKLADFVSTGILKKERRPGKYFAISQQLQI
jgi:mRNA-degrading endonuclease YafQ of YafQ-DinJ toxin-antitoxin module